VILLLVVAFPQGIVGYLREGWQALSAQFEKERERK